MTTSRSNSLPRVAVTGVGLVTSAGVGVEPCMETLLEGRFLGAALGQTWAAPPYDHGAALGAVDVREWVPARRLRRMNSLSRMAVVAAMQALRGADVEPGPSAGVVVGTGLGALADTIEFVGQVEGDDATLASPALFPTTVMNVAAAQISMELGLQGFNTTVNHKEISGELALLLAVDALRVGRAAALLCGGVDELSEPVHHGYRRLGGLSAGAPRPYRAGRDGVMLGEGAAMLLLEPLAEARRRGAAVMAEVAGVCSVAGERPLVAWGPAAEQGRVVGPALDAGVAAVRGAIEQAGLSPGDVDLAIGCGCGSRDLDRLDAQVIRAVFGDRHLPLTSPHGGLGTWMAAGALRLVAAVEVLGRQEVFPTVTSGQPDPDVPVPGLVETRCSGEVNVVLVCGHASGGGSAAALLVR